jgi:uracil-DNA glycosylase
LPCLGRALHQRASGDQPWSEPSATTVWNTLLALGIAADTALWNAFPWHPHRPGQLQSNRTPTGAERARGLVVLDALLSAFPGVPLYAVGRHAEAALRGTGRAVVTHCDTLRWGARPRSAADWRRP